MKRLDKDTLFWYIKELLHLEKDIVVISTNDVIHLDVRGANFYIYIKSVTYAGNPYPKNTTRAQLPNRDIFDEIKNSDAIFLFLGYDVENNVLVCWDPYITKSRLNKKQYVSFFSRLTLQESARDGSIISASLKNDFKYVIFYIDKLPYVLLNIQKYFPDLVLPTSIVSISDKSQGVLRDVEDDTSIKLLIDELYAHNDDISRLSIISYCINEFGVYYNRMKLKDWSKIVKSYLDKKENCFYTSEDIEDYYADVVAEP